MSKLFLYAQLPRAYINTFTILGHFYNRKPNHTNVERNLSFHKTFLIQDPEMFIPEKTVFYLKNFLLVCICSAMSFNTDRFIMEEKRIDRSEYQTIEEER